MLELLSVLVWLIVFALPFILTAVSSVREGGATSTRWWLNSIWALFGAVLIQGFWWALGLWTEVLWYDQIGYVDRFWAEYEMRWLCFAIGTLVSLVFIFLNMLYLRGSIMKVGENKARVYQEIEQGADKTRLVLHIVGLFVALGFGVVLSLSWKEFLLYKNQMPFGKVDPIFGKDISFYVFSLPILRILTNHLAALVFITMALVGIGNLVFIGLYDHRDYAFSGTTSEKFSGNIRMRTISHLSVLGILLMGVFVLTTKLSAWNIMYSQRGAVFGAGWTDIHVQLSAYSFFIGALIIAGLMLLFSAFARSLKVTEWMAGAGFGICLLAWLIGVLLVPAVKQKSQVEANELKYEKPYIQHNIAYTREAYGLTGEKLLVQGFDVQGKIDAEDITKNKPTLSSVRLWDWKVLQLTNNQRQLFRLYYDFPDVDVDRYTIDGRLTQLMLSPREMNQEKLVEKAKTWQNRRLVYTHGYGICASPVNTFVQDGSPDYWISDIPVESRFRELKVSQPRIYFGELTKGHVYVGSKSEEFDYPDGDENKTFKYDGPGGVAVGSGLKKLAFAKKFEGIRLLTSDEIAPTSRILFYRDIATRVEKLAPFLTLDSDPYQIVADGGIWYIWDAYTTTEQYPYSEPHGDFNYIRNSVKITVNAYTGETNFYVSDESDPIIGVYQRIFPKLFKGLSAMPESLRRHVRYPQGLLTVQGTIWSMYHMDNPVVFYNKEDAWQIASEEKLDNQMEPYYVVMRLPGEAKEEFVQMLPFSPLTTDTDKPRSNMTGWLAARCDGNNYGKLICYTFPKGRLVNGPMQITARINQDDLISKDITLWNQQGSQVLFGNLLVIPLSEQKLIYVQPLYLKSEASQMPEIKRVVVADGEQLGYGETFEVALADLVGNIISMPLQGEPESVSPAQRLTVKDAARHYQLYQKLVGQGRMAEAGKELEALGRILESLNN